MSQELDLLLGWMLKDHILVVVVVASSPGGDGTKHGEIRLIIMGAGISDGFYRDNMGKSTEICEHNPQQSYLVALAKNYQQSSFTMANFCTRIFPPPGECASTRVPVSAVPVGVPVALGAVKGVPITHLRGAPTQLLFVNSLGQLRVPKK